MTGFSLVANEAFDAAPCMLIALAIGAAIADGDVVIDNVTAGGRTTINQPFDCRGTMLVLMELAISEGAVARFSSSSKVHMDSLMALLLLLPAPYGAEDATRTCIHIAAVPRSILRDSESRFPEILRCQ